MVAVPCLYHFLPTTHSPHHLGNNKDFNINQFEWPEVKKATASLSTSPKLGSNLQFQLTSSSTMGTGVVGTKSTAATADGTGIALEKETQIKINNHNPIQSFQQFGNNSTQHFQSAFGSASSGGTGAATATATVPQV